ncbi:spindle assembly abnormal protein 6 homolog [Oratosquilla oratoria]|uniref:spindle assembly abnormal protein 6 homolog n=1 Tax=Oratosquilla oratoria TaxID=337810 RepID=UPI003F7751C7
MDLKGPPGSIYEQLYNGRAVVWFDSSGRNGDFTTVTMSRGIDTRKVLTILVETTTGPTQNKELVIRLTDENDPFLLYTCVIKDEDYRYLQQSQGLLVDFQAFPHKFIDLINTCKGEEAKDSPRFLLNVKTGGDGSSSQGTLEVIEVNVFKHLCHLALQLSPAPLQQKLTYLADCLKILKEEKNMLEQKLSETEKSQQSRLRHTQELLAQKTSEVEQLQTELAQQAAAASEKQARILSQEKERLLKTKSDADRKVEREKRELETRLNQRVDQLQDKISSLSEQNNDLRAKRHKADNSLREFQTKLANAEDEVGRCRQELSHTKKHNLNLERECSAKQAMVRDLERRIAQLETELRGSETSLAHCQQMLHTLQQQKTGLEESLEEKRVKLEKRETSIQMLYTDFQKSCEIIKKLQKNLKEQNMKSQVRGAALMEQEKVVEITNMQMAELKEEIKNLSAEFSKVSTEKEALNKEMTEAKEKIEEQDKALKTNENVISWLNKQLNEAETAGVMIKRAPLTEAYLSVPVSQAPKLPNSITSSSSLPPGSGIMSHSTPLSNTSGSTTSGVHSMLSSIRSHPHHLNIPPIPEEISPRNSQTEKENLGLDDIYLKSSKPSTKSTNNPQLSIPRSTFPVQGILRANAVNGDAATTNTDAAGEIGEVGTGRGRAMTVQGTGRGLVRRGGRERGASGRGRSSTFGSKGEVHKKLSHGGMSKPSAYFPRT